MPCGLSGSVAPWVSTGSCAVASFIAERYGGRRGLMVSLGCALWVVGGGLSGVAGFIGVLTRVHSRARVDGFIRERTGVNRVHPGSLG